MIAQMQDARVLEPAGLAWIAQLIHNAPADFALMISALNNAGIMYKTETRQMQTAVAVALSAIITKNANLIQIAPQVFAPQEYAWRKIRALMQF